MAHFEALYGQRCSTLNVGMNLIFRRVRPVAYRAVLPSNSLNLHCVFHVSQLQKYILDLSHVILMDGVQVRDTFTVDALPIRIVDRELKQLRGKEIALVKVVWGGLAGGSMTWEREEWMRESYPKVL
ncbi:uncharacterized protein LOC127093776 [Lathyrus oleraceus]|uniref:uncharacterized protein LOC127093776 n=1 Tax=Pisum sativum TaxID=3888 RepID=UPI0021D09F15|nr:uncharacterized protein LOC127093776 [Pisum sativum]